jgi:hypothetical protein
LGLPFSVQYPANIISGGDKTNQVLQKYYNEFPSNYTEHQNIAIWYEGATSPANPVTGQRWKDTSVSPSVLRRYGGAMNGWVPDELEDRQATSIASAATTDIGSANGKFVQVTGTVTITALGTAPAGSYREVEFMGILLITHNSTSLILQESISKTTAVGDCATFYSLGSGNWICTKYQSNSHPYTTTLTIGSADNAVSATTEIPRNIHLNRITINCRTSANAAQTPSSAVTITLYKTTGGTRTSILTKSITTADTVDATISIDLATNDLIDATMGLANGLNSTANVSLRSVDR